MPCRMCSSGGFHTFFFISITEIQEETNTYVNLPAEADGTVLSCFFFFLLATFNGCAISEFSAACEESQEKKNLQNEDVICLHVV